MAVSSHGLASRADGPNDEGSQHAGGGSQEKLSASDLVDEEAHGQGDDEVDDLEDTVDELLGDRVFDSNLGEDDVDVVGHKTVSRPLREEPGSDQDDQPVAVTLGPPELGPRIAFELLLHLQGVADFLHLKLNNFIVNIAIGVAVGENLQSLLVSAFGDVESRRFRHEPDEAELENRRERLHEGRGSPRPVSGNVVGAEREPGGNDGAEVPGGVVDGSENGSVLGVHELSDQERRRPVGDRNTESEEEASGHEHAEVDGDGLEHDTENHDHTSDEHTRASPEDIGNVWHERNGAKRADGHDTAKKTKERATRMAEIVLPSLKRLQTVHHGTIVSVCCLFPMLAYCTKATIHARKAYRCQDNEHEADVGLPHARVGVPCHAGELPAGELERLLVGEIHDGW